MSNANPDFFDRMSEGWSRFIGWMDERVPLTSFMRAA